jgi:hypothetical protein
MAEGLKRAVAAARATRPRKLPPLCKTALGHLTDEQIHSLLRIGSRMANWFFNAKQHSNDSSSFAHEQIRKDAAALQEEWDKARAAKA